MFVIVAITAAVTTGAAIILHQLRKAPVGYEDAGGFHLVQQLKASGVRRYRRLDPATAAALKSARAHS